MRVLRRELISIVLIVGCSIPTNAFSQEPDTTDGYFLPGVSANFYYDYSENTKLFGFDGSGIADFYGGTLEFNASISFLRFVKMDGQTIYSAGLPVTAGLWAIANLASKIFIDEDTTRFPHSRGQRVTPFHLLFLMPNSTFRVRVTNSLRPTLSFNTEYLFGGSSKGILFTPKIGVSIYRREGNYGRYGWDLHVGRSMFWSFENKTRANEFVFGVTMFGYPFD